MMSVLVLVLFMHSFHIYFKETNEILNNDDEFVKTVNTISSFKDISYVVK